MKFLAVLLLAGVAVAAALPFSKNIDAELESSLNEFISSAADEGNDLDVSKLKEKFQELLKKLKDAFEQGKSFKDALEKLQQIKEKLKDLHVELGDKGKEYLELFKEKVKEYWKQLKEKLVSKRFADEELFDNLRKLKEMLERDASAEELKSFVEQIFGEGKSNEFTEHFFKLLDEGPSGKQKLLDWIDRVLGEKDQ